MFFITLLHDSESDSLVTEETQHGIAITIAWVKAPDSVQSFTAMNERLPDLESAFI